MSCNSMGLSPRSLREDFLLTFHRAADSEEIVDISCYE
jgi:hypothetical protein